MTDVEVLALKSDEPTTHEQYYQLAGEIMLVAAECNSQGNFADAKLNIDIAQTYYQRGHAINPLFNIEQSTDLGE